MEAQLRKILQDIERQQKYDSFEAATGALKNYVKDVKQGEWADYVHIMRLPQKEDAFVIVDDYTGGGGSPVMLAMYYLNYRDIANGDMMEEADKGSEYYKEVLEETLKDAREHYNENQGETMSHP